MRRLGVALTGSYAVFAATVSALGFRFSTLVEQTFAVPIFLIGFLMVVATLAFLAVARARRQPPREPGSIPDWLFALLLATGLVAVSCAIGGIVLTGGYSAGEEFSDGCRWPIVTDHGSTVHCVSHARWVQVENGFFHIGLGLLGLFSSILCGLWSRIPTAGPDGGYQPA